MKYQTKKIDEFNSDTVVCFAFEDYNKKSELFEYLNKLSNDELKNQFEYGLRILESQCSIYSVFLQNAWHCFLA